MPYLQKKDFDVVLGGRDALGSVDDATRARAEAVAMEEAAGYLRGRYDMAAEFAKAAPGEGGVDERNSRLVGVVVDVALWHLSAALPGGVGVEVRAERYERALEWLRAAGRGDILADLRPLAPSGEGGGGFYLFGSERALTHNW